MNRPDNLRVSPFSSSLLGGIIKQLHVLVIFSQVRSQNLRDQSLILNEKGWKTTRRGEFCTLRGRGMKGKEHSERNCMEFLLKSWSGEQNFYITVRGGQNSIK